MTDPGVPDRPRRRHDPGRRDRIIDAAIDVIVDRGVAGTTHRRITTVADVPLGSMTHHFRDLNKVLWPAFERHATQAAARFDASVAGVPAGEMVDAVVHLVCGPAGEAGRDLVLSLELYGLAARRPEFRAITQQWMAASRRTLERHVDPRTAPSVDALIEGLILHRALSTEPLDEDRVRSAVRQLLEPSDRVRLSCDGRE